MKKNNLFIIYFSFLCFFLGCAVNNDLRSLYPVNESSWIRDGQPIEFENSFWYPTDNIENLLDKEMFLLGDYRGVQFFVEKRNIRPFKYIYTKFDEHKYRQFEKKDD